MTEIYLLLVHGPVRGQSGETITTATTPLDVSDIARSCRTFGLAGYGIVQPDHNQCTLVHRMQEYWLERDPEHANRSRAEALQMIETFPTIEDAIAQWGQGILVATSATAGPGTVSWEQLRARSEAGERIYLLFGTGYGLVDSMMRESDCIAPSIKGVDGYAHLSVRSAVAIILDRILGH